MPCTTVLGQNCPSSNAFFAPREVGRIRANRLNNVSGIAASALTEGFFWVHNGGKIDRFFAITREGRPAGTFILPRPLVDAGEITIGPGVASEKSTLYLADIGDLAKERRSFVVVRVEEPPLTPDQPKSVEVLDAVYLTFSYPDAGHDAQTLLADPISGDLCIITKEEGQGIIFRAARERSLFGNNPILERAGTIPMDGITGGAVSRDGQRIALRNRESVRMWRRALGESIPQALVRSAPLYRMDSQEPAGALTFAIDGSGYFQLNQGDDQPILFHQYNRTAYTIGRALGILSAPILLEVSGIAAGRKNPEMVWAHNDGTNRTVVAVATSGRALASFELREPVVDLEDIAIGPGNQPGTSNLYLADIGDNHGERETIRIVSVAEPDLAALDGIGMHSFDSEASYTLKYPDGPHDAEALLIDPATGDFFIATKEDHGFRLYLAQPSAQEEAQLDLVLVQTGRFALVSGGDISSDGRLIALRREDAARLWIRQPGQTIAEAMGGEGAEIPVIGPPGEPNGEGLAFLPEGGGYLTASEGKSQPLYQFEPLHLPAFAGLPTEKGGTWCLAVKGCAGTEIELQVSRNLPFWERLSEITLEGNPVSILDSIHSSRSFYRIRLVPP